ncbi:MAG: A/G-specific adenine glycosylase [Chloroflexi bacterium]|nr:A/G-specific adenine glycosylase [Chloroflexota bacterium]
MHNRLLDWYDKNARVLPWRSDPSPYKVWLSEVMLQQTRVETVLPYFDRFLTHLPTLKTLAEARLEEVLVLWEGLGYYSRARNLHKAARIVQSDYAGKLPASAKELVKLPGIGKYTSAAIASIAFGEPVAAVDGNVRRVFARLLALEEPIGTSSLEKTVLDYAQLHLPAKRPGDFNQALMDLGSMVCLPAQPKCPICPVQSFCSAFVQGKQNNLPKVIKKAPTPHYDVCVAVIWHEGKVLLAQRADKGLLAKLWEYPGGKISPADKDQEDGVQREVLRKTGLEITPTRKIGDFKHAYTHFRISVQAWYARLLFSPPVTLPDNLRWVSPGDLSALPMGKVARRISERVNSDFLQAENQ